MNRMAKWLAVAAAVLLVVWHVVPIYEEKRWLPEEVWTTMFGWSVWPEVVSTFADAPSMALHDPDTWVSLVMCTCLASGVLGVFGLAVAVWFAVPRLLRVAAAAAMTMALAGGPGVLAYAFHTDPPDPDSMVLFPTFGLWPAAVAVAWMASILWAIPASNCLAGRGGGAG